MTTEIRQCDMCHEYYWLDDIDMVDSYFICQECIDFIDQGLECEA